MEMTVQQLIDRLMKISDKNKKVVAADIFGDMKDDISVLDYENEVEIYGS